MKQLFKYLALVLVVSVSQGLIAKWLGAGPPPVENYWYWSQAVVGGIFAAYVFRDGLWKT